MKSMFEGLVVIFISALYWVLSRADRELAINAAWVYTSVIAVIILYHYFKKGKHAGS